MPVLHSDLLSGLPAVYRESPEFLYQYGLACVRAEAACSRIVAVQFCGVRGWAFWREYQPELAEARELNRIVYDPLIGGESTRRDYLRRRAE
jgi:hypothetical protein